MSEQENPGEEEKEDARKPAVPEGRRVVKQKRRKSGGASRETLILKKREIISEMVQPEESAPVNVREQVERLKQARKDKKSAQDPAMEEKWGSRKHRRRGSRWLLALILVVALPLLAFVIVVTFNGASGGSASRAPDTLNLDEEEPLYLPFDRTDPVSWFHEHSVEAFEEALEIMDEINKGETAEATVHLLRDAERTREKIRETRFEWPEKFRVSDPRTLSWSYDASGDTGFIAINGKDSSFKPFRAYFVRSQDGLRLDWEATTAYSQIPVAGLTKEASGTPVMIRGWVAKKPSFDTEVGGRALLSWYQVLSQDRNEYVWAYTSLGSEVDAEIRKALNYGLMVMKRVEETRMIVRLRPGFRSARPNEYELVEVVAKDWVQP